MVKSQCYLVAAACLLIGCGSPAGKFVEEKIEQTHKVEPNVVINIENPDGSIMVYGANESELTFWATKRAYSQKRLDEIKIKVSAQPGTVSITTEFPPRAKWGLSDRSGTVNYVLVVPQTASIGQMKLQNGELMLKDMRGGLVHADLGNGWVYVQNSFNDLDLSVGMGGIMILFQWWESGNFTAAAKIESGKTLVWLPVDASFHIIAEASTGQLVNDFADPQERSAEPVRTIDKRIGPSPNAAIKLRAAEGNIKITAERP